MSNQVTSGRAWRKPREEGFIINLPSGNVAKLRPVALDRLVLTGRIPDLLSPVAAEALWVQTNEAEMKGQGELLKRYTELVNLIVPFALMEPRIVESPTGDDEITLDDLDFTDKVAIFQVATQPATVLKRFREQQAGSLVAVHDSQDDGATPLLLGSHS